MKEVEMGVNSRAGKELALVRLLQLITNNGYTGYTALALSFFIAHSDYYQSVEKVRCSHYQICVLIVNCV